MELGLDGKVVIVTGCNGGIGESLCVEFLREGSRVAGFYRGELGKLDGLFQAMAEAGISPDLFLPVNVDINSTPSIQAALEQVQKHWDRVDVLVNNAGWTVEKPFLSLEDEEIDQIYSSNLASLAKLSRETLRVMMRQKAGNIVNVSSMVSRRYGRGVAYYASMKAGVNRLTEVLALEMGKKNIRVNSVCPGVVETRMSNGLQDRHEKLLIDKTPLQRYAKPEEIAKSVLFLASDRAAGFITGASLFVDGGIGL